MGVALAATMIHTLPFAPLTTGDGSHPIDAVALAVVMGVLLGNCLPNSAWLKAGADFTLKKILPIGVVLLGARIHIGDMMTVGAAAFLIASIEILLAIGVVLLLGRWLKLPQTTSLLLGVGTAICGAAAIVATAPVLRAKQDQVAITVTTVALIGLGVMLILPVVGRLLDLSEATFGTWAGLVIHQTPQVVAAGFAYGNEAGDMATCVKLMRICLLLPVVFLISCYASRQSAHTHHHSAVSYFSLMPIFVFGLIFMALMRSLGFLVTIEFSEFSIDTVEVASTLSNICILISMAGIGLVTRLTDFNKSTAGIFLCGIVVSVVVISTSFWMITTWL